ncbi:hypothetical protein [Fluviicola sp.]|uniref:hypothetical protein n=1 Tax=Fluviicola sp. TaxID=1917219 RepID=UPI003D2903DB
MKSPEFFIDKATELITGIDTMLAEPLSIKHKWLYAFNPEGNEEDYGRNVDKVKTTYYQVQLMFGEFDNNEPFIESIKDLKPASFEMVDNEKLLSQIKSLVELFTNHVREYRMNEF